MLTSAANAADGEHARVKIGAIPQILEHMLFAGKRRLPQPSDPFSSHLGEGLGAAVRHPRRHVVAADTAHRVAALRHFGGGVVGTTGAKVGCTRRMRLRVSKRAFLLFDPGDA